VEFVCLLASLPSDLGAGTARVGREFSSLGAALRSVSERARELATLSRQITGLGAAAESDRAIETLQEILADAERVRGLAATGRERLQEILDNLKRARAPLQRLAKVRSMLHAVGTLSRIEESRLGAVTVDVSSLASGIDSLAEQIEGRVAAIGEESAHLTEIAGHALQQLNQDKDREEEEAAGLMGHTRSVLAPVHARAQTSRAAAQDIDEQYAGIRTTIDRIVMSLQTEDIARQRVEHVQEALMLAAAPGAAVPDLPGILALQHSQLSGARDLLSQSIDNVMDSLQSLNPRIEQVVAATAALASQTGRDGRSFAAAIAEGLKGVSAVFAQYSSSAQSVESIVESVLPSVAAMAKGANELEDIEASIRLIALNAAIKTAHLGAQGTAMSVLAAELQNLTTLGEEHTRVVLGSLTAMDQALSALSGHTRHAADSVLMSGSAQHVTSEVSRLAESVIRAGEEMSRKLSALSESAGSLGSKLERSCKMAEQGRTSLAAYDESLHKLENCLQELGYRPGTAAEADGAAGLENLYSMQAERDTHRQIFGGETAANDDAQPGDIELF
jgi:hypothetical protein